MRLARIRGVYPRSRYWDGKIFLGLFLPLPPLLHQRSGHWGLAILETVVDVGRLHLGVLPVVSRLRCELPEGLHHIEEYPGTVEALDDVLAKVPGPVLLVSRDEQPHGVVLHMGGGHNLTINNIFW